MPDLADGESTEMKGSGSNPYTLKNVGGVYSCNCPAWRNQSLAIERRTCKHLRKLRGDAAEEARIGAALPATPLPAADGESTEGPPVLLAESWDNDQDLTGWWMSEKLDGVRAYWDGQQFLSRQGNRYHAPAWFTRGLPNLPLDGELWIGRKAFQRTVGIVRRQDQSDHWKEVKFLIFDAPGHDQGFERRVEWLQTQFTTWATEYRQLVEQIRCTGTDQLRAELRRIEALGGEGLMLRQPGSKYVAGRSSTLLKVKSFHGAEAEVIGHEPGKGKHAGRLGAVTARLPNGKTFSVGTGFSDKERENPPAVGSVITFRYQELSDGGIPRFPSFVRIRTDNVPSPTPKPTPKPAPAVSPTAPEKKNSPPATDIETFRLVDDDPPTQATPPAKVTPTPKSKGTVPVSTTNTATAKRRFEFSEGTSNKFWEIVKDGLDVTTTWGKIGTGGQTKTKTFADEAKAQKEYDKLIEEKTEKGYIEQ